MICHHAHVATSTTGITESKDHARPRKMAQGAGKRDGWGWGEETTNPNQFLSQTKAHG